MRPLRRWRTSSRLAPHAAAEMERLARVSHHPVLFTEVGIPSLEGAAAAPWDYTARGECDLELQRLSFEAFGNVFRAQARSRGTLPGHVAVRLVGARRRGRHQLHGTWQACGGSVARPAALAAPGQSRPTAEQHFHPGLSGQECFQKAWIKRYVEFDGFGRLEQHKARVAAPAFLVVLHSLEQRGGCPSSIR